MRAGDLRRHRAHYDVIVLITFIGGFFSTLLRTPSLVNYLHQATKEVKAADDDAGKLQSVFLKRLYLLHICIFSFFLFNASLTTI